MSQESARRVMRSRANVEQILTIRVAVINIPSKVGPGAWATCFQRTAHRSSVFGINEAVNPRAKALYRTLARDGGLGHAGLRSPNPIFWDREVWRRVSSRVHQLHGKGPNRAYPGFNGPRYANTVVLRHRESGEEWAFICWHGVPEGRKVPDWWREQVRREYPRQLGAIIAEHRAQGRRVALIGDTNIRGRWPLDGVVWAEGIRIDKVGFAGVQQDEVSSETYDAPTDHKHGTVATVEVAVPVHKGWLPWRLVQRRQRRRRARRRANRR